MAGHLEQAINKPLSGEEIRAIIMTKIKDLLDGDCRLSSHTAFVAMRGKFSIALELEGNYPISMDRETEFKVGKPGEDPNRPAEYAVMTEAIDPMHPNEARYEAGLDIPTLSHDEKGRQVERGVNYGKKAKAKK